MYISITIFSFIFGIIFTILFTIVAIKIHNIPHKKLEKTKRKTAEKETVSFTKIVVASVMLTYFIGVAIGGYIVLKEYDLLGTYLTFIGSATATTIALYCWKAKAENMIKIKTSNPKETKGISVDLNNINL